MQRRDKDSRTLIQLFQSSPCISDRYEHLSHILSQVNLSGLYLEFGVFKGDSINYIANAISPRLIYGFDSFIGLPEEWKRRKDGCSTLPIGTFAVDALPEVLQNVRLIKGWFKDTLPTFISNHAEDIAFINIDSDLYSAAKTILTSLNEQIVPGTIIYFDEITGWGELIDQYDTWEDGEYKALLEWIWEYEREVETISRNKRYGAAIRVVR